MSFDAKRLNELLPAVYRIRDTEQSGALNDLLSVIADQISILEDNLAQLYDDGFVETCASWVLPYIGDLIGVTGLSATGPQLRSPRAEVAHTIAYRRRKGTAATLEQLAHDITGWPARAVEFFQLLATTQYMNHLRPWNQSVISVRNADRLEYLNTPFEHLQDQPDLTHTVDVRRISSGRGKYNIPNVGIFLWRRKAYSLTLSPAVPKDSGDNRNFRFHPLGIDSGLITLPLTEDEFTHLAEPINVPGPISRRALIRDFGSYYGRGKSFHIVLADGTAVASGDVQVCDLTGWVHQPAAGVAVDPVSGRMTFAGDQAGPPLVSFHYGFSSETGGGEYDRVLSAPTVFDQNGAPVLLRVGGSEPYQSIQAAIDDLGPSGGIVEITDSGRYEETLTIDAGSGHVEVRAASRRRPTIVLGGDFSITGDDGAQVALSGLLIAGAGINVGGNLSGFRLEHCTLVPGLALNSDGTPVDANAPSLTVTSVNASVTIDHSILGGVRAAADANAAISTCVVDATDEAGVAYAGLDGHSPGATVSIQNSTVTGKVSARVLQLASNTIFLATVAPSQQAQWAGPIVAERRQQGCVRFSYLPVGSRTPRRYRCQPETDADVDRVRPVLLSTRYGDAGYCELSPGCPQEIRQGADDESEMGVFHDLFEPQREAHLRARLDEYLRFGLEAGVFFVS
jgi:hypothetical protein